MKIRKDYSLKKHNTFGIDVSSKRFISFETQDEIQKWLSENKPSSHDILVLGGGSNFLFTKEINKTILFPEIKGIHIVKESDDAVWVEAGAGVVWDDFVDYTVSKNWGGAENLSLIPGMVGATPVQNIGAYGVEIKDILHEATALELATGQEKKILASRMRP